MLWRADAVIAFLRSLQRLRGRVLGPEQSLCGDGPYRAKVGNP
jgi:hypothetical protein